ncbi:unnamed protein product [Sphagnum troendelagicum]
MKVPSFLRIRRTQSLQSPSVSSSSSDSSPSSSSELSSSPGRRPKELSSLERQALSLPKTSSSFTSWMWRQSKRWSMSGELLGKPTQRNSSRRSELCVPSCSSSSELAEVFTYFDKNGVGKISAVELGLVLSSLGIEYTDKELELMVREVDVDGDGFIDLEEFINLNKLASQAIMAGEDDNNTEHQENSTAAELEVLRDAFHVFDVEKKGYISADSLHRILSGLGDECITLEDCRRMIHSVDQDGDGRVDFHDFQLMMMHGSGSSNQLVC